MRLESDICTFEIYIIAHSELHGLAAGVDAAARDTTSWTLEHCDSITQPTRERIWQECAPWVLACKRSGVRYLVLSELLHFHLMYSQQGLNKLGYLIMLYFTQANLKYRNANPSVI